MTTKQIDYCIELARTLNFSRAAENAFVSQPTFSYQVKLLEDVCEADAQKLKEAISKENLVHQAEQEETMRLPFTKLKNGTEVTYSLRTIRTRESDHHHIVIGIRQEDRE